MAKVTKIEQPANKEEVKGHVDPKEMDKIIKEGAPKAKLAIEDMPLENITDYVRYNREARALNKKLGICRYPAKPCPVELHPKETIVFNRKDQPSNPLPVMLSNDVIDFKMTLIPGKTYELPRCIIAYLASKGRPEWKWFENADGSRETRKASMDPRFALRTIYEED